MRRVFPRTSRGADEEYLTRGVAIFEWEYNIERVTAEFLGAMLGVPITTVSPHERHASFGRGGEAPHPFPPLLVQIYLHCLVAVITIHIRKS